MIVVRQNAIYRFSNSDACHVMIAAWAIVGKESLHLDQVELFFREYLAIWAQLGLESLLVFKVNPRWTLKLLLL